MARGLVRTKYVSISPKKARKEAHLIRGKAVSEAVLQLGVSTRKGGRLLLKSLKSAIANAENEHGLRPEEMKVLEVRVDDGPSMKRGKPKNKGGSHPIIKRTSHFTIIVGE